MGHGSLSSWNIMLTNERPASVRDEDRRGFVAKVGTIRHIFVPSVQRENIPWLQHCLILSGTHWVSDNHTIGPATQSPRQSPSHLISHGCMVNAPQISNFSTSESRGRDLRTYISENKYRSIAHQPPEMLNGNPVMGGCAGDMYSFGVLLWQASDLGGGFLPIYLWERRV